MKARSCHARGGVNVKDAMEGSRSVVFFSTLFFSKAGQANHSWLDRLCSGWQINSAQSKPILSLDEDEPSPKARQAIKRNLR